MRLVGSAGRERVTGELIAGGGCDGSMFLGQKAKHRRNQKLQHAVTERMGDHGVPAPFLD